MNANYISDWDEFFMRHVYLVASKSKDPRTQIGAVLVRDGIVISEGFNGFPRGVEDLPERYEDRPTKYQYVVHAEANAVLNCARLGISTLGSIMYTTGVPCNECAKSVIQGGIRAVFIHANLEKLDGPWAKAREISTKMFEEAGVQIIELSTRKLNLTIMRDGKLAEV